MRGAALAVLLTVTSAATGSVQAASDKEIFEAYRDSVVAVTFTLRPKEKPTGGQGRKIEEAMCGVLVDSSGLIITSADPFPEPGGDPKTTLVPVEFTVHLRGDRKFEADPVGLNRDLNIAYLRLRSTPEGIRPIDFSQGDGLEVGDEMLVVGLMSRHYDFEPTYYRGFVNARIRKPRLMYSLDLPVQDLSIGGLAVTRSGRAVGIIGEDLLPQGQSSERRPSNILSLIGSSAQGQRVGYPMIFPYRLFAAEIASPPPIDIEEKRSWLGIIMQPLSEELIDYWRLDVRGGIIISSVVDGSPAQGAGLKTSDILVSLEGEPLTITEDEDLPEFRRRIERMGAGSQVRLGYLRSGVPGELTLTLGEAPTTAWTAEEIKDEDLGLTVREITLDDILGQNLEPGVDGVVVSELEQAGWAQIGGVLPGDIIQAIDGQVISDLDSYSGQIDRLREEKPTGILLFVLRQTETLFVRLKTSW